MTSLVSSSELVGKTLILSIKSGSMCKHHGSTEQSGFYTTLQFLGAEQNPVWNYMTVLGKKKIIVQRRGGGVFSLPLPSCQKQGKLKHRK